MQPVANPIIYVVFDTPTMSFHGMLVDTQRNIDIRHLSICECKQSI